MEEITRVFLSAKAGRKSNEPVEKVKALAYGEDNLDVPGCPGTWLGHEFLGQAPGKFIEGSCHSAECPLPSGPGKTKKAAGKAAGWRKEAEVPLPCLSLTSLVPSCT